jgi:acetoin utilization protein AcuB
MLVRDWMHTHVIAADTDDTVETAIGLFQEHNVSLLPVTHDGKLMGILTPKDLKQASSSSEAEDSVDVQGIPDEVRKLKVTEIMTREPLAVPPDFTVEETAEMLLERKIPGCPVLDHHGRMVGIVTKRDLLEAMVVASGTGKLGILFGFIVKDEPDCISELYDVIRKYDARACSIMSCYANAPEGYRYLQIRAFNINRRKLDNLKQELKDRADVLFIVDRREGTREVFSSK